MSHFPILHSLYVHFLVLLCLPNHPVSLEVSGHMFPNTRYSPLFIFPAATCQGFIYLSITIALQPGWAAPTRLRGHGLL